MRELRDIKGFDIKAEKIFLIYRKMINFQHFLKLLKKFLKRFSMMKHSYLSLLMGNNIFIE